MQPKVGRTNKPETLQLILNKTPASRRGAHRTFGIMNNLLSASVLVDAELKKCFYGRGVYVTLNREVILWVWRDIPTKLWRVSLIPDGGDNILPFDTNIIDEESTPKCLSHSIFECDTTSQLIKFYHATMVHPVISTWCKAIDSGYFRGWPGLTSNKVPCHISVTT